MKILLIGDYFRFSNGVQELGMIKACEDLGHEYKIYDPSKQSTHENIKEGYDLVIHGIQNYRETTGLMKRLKSNGTKKQIFYWCDYRPEFDQVDEWRKQGKMLDHMFISNRAQLTEFERILGVEAHFMAQAAYIPMMPPKDIEQYEDDLVFIGTNGYNDIHGRRTEMLKSIGVDYNHINAGGDEGKNLVWGKMGEIYRNAKLVLDISAYWDVDSYASGRFFHVCGYGGVTVTKRFLGQEEFGYQDGVHKIFFDTPDEAREKIRHFLVHETRRERMRWDSYEHTKNNHTYTNRLEEMLTYIT